MISVIIYRLYLSSDSGEPVLGFGRSGFDPGTAGKNQLRGLPSVQGPSEHRYACTWDASEDAGLRVSCTSLGVGVGD
jgi:hypothetical protein